MYTALKLERQKGCVKETKNSMKCPERESKVIERIRIECRKKGLYGVRGFSVLFRGMDRDYSKTLTPSEIRDGLARFGIHVSSEDVQLVFKNMDNDGSGAIDFKEFVMRLNPEMPACRCDIVNEAFDKLDYNKDNVLKIDDLMVTYRSHAANHPKFKSGEWSMEKVLRTFLETFDSPTDKDGVVTRQEFIEYYTGVSCMIDDNSYFDLMMRACWGLPPKQTISKQNTFVKPV